MPYIPEDERDTAIHTPKSAGQLNYAITQLLVGYAEREGLCYQTINDIVGAMECCKSEFYRRVVIPYEEAKREDNGDVYGGLV